MIFNRPTDRSRESVDAAFEEARMLGHDSLGDETFCSASSAPVWAWAPRRSVR